MAQKTDTIPITPENMRKMALETIQYLAKRGLFFDVDIYAGGMHYSDMKHSWQELDRNLIPGVPVWAGKYETCPCEYQNPDTLTMTFEGPLYNALNHNLGYGDRCSQELNAIFAKYGLQYELGHAWSMTCYEA